MPIYFFDLTQSVAGPLPLVLVLEPNLFRRRIGGSGSLQSSSFPPLAQQPQGAGSKRRDSRLFCYSKDRFSSSFSSMDSTHPASAPAHVTCVQGIPVVAVSGCLDTVRLRGSAAS